MANDFIKDESELGPNWVPAENTTPIVPGKPAAPSVGMITPVNPQYLQGTIPPNVQHDPHFVDTEYQTPNAPRFSLMPLGLHNAITSTQISSAIRSSGVTAAPATTTEERTEVESIGINKHTGTAYTVQLSDLNTLITVDNNAGGVITLPSPGGTGIGGNSVDGAAEAFGVGSATGISFTPSFPGDFALLATAAQNNSGAFNPIGWTSEDTSGGSSVFFQQATGGSAITASGSLTGTNYWAQVLAGFRSSGTVTFVQQNAISGALGTSPHNLAYTSNVTQGNALVAVVLAAGSDTNADLTMAFTDNIPGDSWALVGAADNRQDPSVHPSGHAQVWATPCKGSGPCTVTFQPSFTISSSVVYIFEISGLISTGPSSSTFPPFWFTYVQNTSNTDWTVSSLAKIDEKNQSITLPPNTGMLIVYDGSTWFTMRGIDTPYPVTFNPVTHEFLIDYDSSTGDFSAAQPAFTDISGTAQVAQGGTGDNTLAAHAVLIGEGTSPVATAAPNTAGQVLTSNGPSADPSFQSVSLSAAVKINGVGTSPDKRFYVDAVSDGSTPFGSVQINGVSDGG